MKINTQPALVSRRALLRGVGASLALPWLESLTPAWAQSPSAPRRLFVLYTPNGYNMDRFWPSNEGALTEASLNSTSLSALSP